MVEGRHGRSGAGAVWGGGVRERWGQPLVLRLASFKLPAAHREKFLYATDPLTQLHRKLLPRDPTQRRESNEHCGPNRPISRLPRASNLGRNSEVELLLPSWIAHNSLNYV